MTTTSVSGGGVIALDVEGDKAVIEEHIVDHIQERMPDVERKEIEVAVESVYERLLDQARIKLHIPTLVEHDAADEIRENHRDD